MLDSFASKALAFCAPLIFLVVGPCLSEAQEHNSIHAMRDWHDANGRKMTAILVSSDGTTVTLQKDNGQQISIAVNKLSDSDQSYLRKSPEGERSELDIKSAELCEQIGKSYNGRRTTEKPKIAVVDFTDLEGRVSNLGRLLSEELISRLFLAGNFRVVERLLLNKTIEEHKLQLQGLVEPRSAKELGKLLGADAIVCGTLADVGDSVRVNARLISTETGEVLSVAMLTLQKDKLAKVSGGNMGEAGGALRAVGGKVKLPYREDFSGYSDGQTTGWGANGKIITGADNRKWLAPAQNGQNPVGVDVDLPNNGYIEFEYSTNKLEGNRDSHDTLSGITLVDEAGAKYRIEFVINVDKRAYSFKLPGGARLGDHWADYTQGTVHIQKAGNQIGICLAKNGGTLTADVSDFKRFTRMEVDLYKGPNSQIIFTNFKIGGAATQRAAGTTPRLSRPTRGPQAEQPVPRP